MKTTFKLLAGLFLLSTMHLSAQNGVTQQAGVPPYQGKPSNTTQAAPGDPLPSPQNGNGVLGIAYYGNECGLNYVYNKQRLGQRFFPVGLAQPAAFPITGIPAGAVIERAFIWAEGSGNGAALTVTLQNPSGSTVTFPMTLAGSDADKCWGYPGSHTYRANVTPNINAAMPNGTYFISGLPTGTPNDIDGATLLIVYSVPNAGFNGELVIHDGAVVRLGVPVQVTMTNIFVCASGGNNARAFMGIGDLQGLGSQLELNGVTGIPAQEDWWDWVDVPTTVTPGQTTATFGNNVQSDCYNIGVIGMYWQSACGPNCPFPCEAKPDFTFSGCNPIQFNGTNSGVSPVASWFWQFGDGGTSTLQNPSHFYATPGVYQVCLTIVSYDSDGKTCCEQVCRTVTVCPPQPCGVVPEVKWGCNRNNPSEIVFQDVSVVTGGSVCGYQIDYGDGTPAFFSTTIPPHVYPPGSWEACIEVIVCVYDAFGNVIDRCSDKVCFKVETCIIILPVRLANPNGGTSEQPQDLNIFPSPASTQINIVVANANAAQVRIMNAAGQEVASGTQQSSRAWQADISTLAQGTYFVVVRTHTGEVIKKPFIKE
jgi:hypothetical protein